MDSATGHLVDFALAANFDSLSAETAQDAKRRLIDAIGCALGAYDDFPCVVARDYAAERSMPAQATLWGSGAKCAAEMAAFANGTMIRVQDFNDTFFAVDGGHPSDMLGGLVAAAESKGADGRALITAIAIAYEVYCRFMQSVPISTKNFDQPINVAVASAVAIGKLYNLSRDQLAHAIALAVTPHLALRQTRRGVLSHWKGMAGPNAARDALFAVDLAARGVTGPSDLFEGQEGLWSVLGKREWVEPAKWGKMEMVSSTYLKNYAVCYHAQSGSQAALDLYPRVKNRGIAGIEVEAYHDAWEMIGLDPTRWAPTSRETADHSLPFTVATCLVHGELSSDSFDESRLDEPAVKDVMAKVAVREDKAFTKLYPNAAATRVTIKMADGDVLRSEVLHPKGHPKSPMSDDDIEAKFNSLARKRLTDRERVAALDTLWKLETAKNVAVDLVPKLAGSGDVQLKAAAAR